MAKVRVIPEKDWEVLEKYICRGEEAYVFVPEKNLAVLSEDQAEKISRLDRREIDYDFGGEADIWIDVADGDNFCMRELLDLEDDSIF